ncbi:Glutaminase A [Lachnellula suecica]|uniref:Glutaminase A n=1 Tax=Lachnellula suecica TaxID=602035 RepID=A0A8T9CCV1_9HELO|nr:Glutaminase A [Lachnellula suecica]
MKYHLLVVTLGALACGALASTFTPARPPAIPLAVKSPYLSSWLPVGKDGGAGGTLAGTWPQFWVGGNTGWTGLIKVDGKSYTWMGNPRINNVFPPNVDQISFEYTSTRSTFMMNVENKILMNVTFVSPTTPTDLRRQSVIGSYLEVTVASADRQSHNVQLYTDTSAEWAAAGNGNKLAQASNPLSFISVPCFSNQNGIASHRFWLQQQSEFNQDVDGNDDADWGYWYYSTAATASMTYESGTDQNVRQHFLSTGKLQNTEDTNYRAINNDWPVFGLANDLGNVGDDGITTLYTIVHAQQNAISFNGAGGKTVSVPSLWTSYFRSDADLVNFFHNDYVNEVGAVDHAIAHDALAAGGQDYLTITSLSVRQAFAGVQLCGTIDKPYLFLKEISSDGNLQTVDVLFPSIPIFLYANPILIKYMLDPLYENQEAGLFPQKYSIHDLGSHYPQATGHPSGDGEEMPVEECGNMIISTLAYAQRAADKSYLSQHYPLMQQWTEFLVTDALIPDNQLSTDDFQGRLANQTNLALKGIIAIEAMSVIAKLVGKDADATKYTNIAHDYINKWQKLAVVTTAKLPHTNLDYQDSNSHGLLYNLYADKLLGLNLVPQSIYDMQSEFYPTIAQEYGVPLDSRNTATKTDWQMWASAISSPSTQTMFNSLLVKWINATPTKGPFSDLIDVVTSGYGGGQQFRARPVVGGHFAAMALAPTSAGAKRVVEAQGRAWNA